MKSLWILALLGICTIVCAQSNNPLFKPNHIKVNFGKLRAKSMTRKYIVKCCGKVSCTNHTEGAKSNKTRTNAPQAKNPHLTTAAGGKLPGEIKFTGKSSTIENTPELVNGRSPSTPTETKVEEPKAGDEEAPAEGNDSGGNAGSTGQNSASAHSTAPDAPSASSIDAINNGAASSTPHPLKNNGDANNASIAPGHTQVPGNQGNVSVTTAQAPQVQQNATQTASPANNQSQASTAAAGQQPANNQNQTSPIQSPPAANNTQQGNASAPIPPPAGDTPSVNGTTGGNANPENPVAANSNETASNDPGNEEPTTTTTTTTTEPPEEPPTDAPDVPLVYDDPAGVTPARDLEVCDQFNKGIKALGLVEGSTWTTPAPILGTVMPACGREYFFGKTAANVFKVGQNCALKNLSLLSLETVKEKNCLDELLPRMALLGSKFWTSIANEGPNIASYLQCASNVEKIFPDEMKNESFWAIAAAKTPKLQRCLAYKINKTATDTTFGFLHESCDKMLLPYICEPKCQISSCPETCSSNASLFEDGKLKDMESYGLWVERCGKKYLFGKKLATWEQNWNFCCELGMEPVVLESAEEQSCLSNLTTATNWKYNFNYWTGGTAKGCTGSWKWCGSVADPVVKTGLLWAPKEPDNKSGNETCMHMRIFNKAPTVGVRLTDRKCSDKYVVACQGSPTVPKFCNDGKPTCPDIKCARDPALFTGNTLNGYAGYGVWISGCNRNFLFSNTKLTWDKAYAKCCSMGLNLLSVENYSKHTCLVRATEADSKTVNEFWTAGTDEDCPDRYHWCSVDYPFKPTDINWAAGQPKTADGDCVYVKSTQKVNTTVYATDACSKEKFFICEVRMEGTAPEAMQEECSSIEGASSNDIDALSMVYTANDFDMPPKCFLRCLGENEKLFYMNALLPVPTIRRIETHTQDDPIKLQQGLNTYDTCKDERHVSNECITASNIFECSTSKAGPIVDAMVTSVTSNTTVYTPPVPCVKQKRLCSAGSAFTCTPDSAKIALLQSKGSIPEGRMVTTAAGKKYFASIHSSARGKPYDMKTAYETCCALGMKMFMPKDCLEMKQLGKAAQHPGAAAGSFIGFTKPLDATNEVYCDKPTLLLPKVPAISGYPGYKCSQTFLMTVLYSGGGTCEMVIKPITFLPATFHCE